MSEEVTFYQGGNIVVTNARFIVGSQTFAIRGVTSIEGVEQWPSFVGFLILALFGLIAAIALFSAVGFSGIWGVLIATVGVLGIIFRKPTFSVVLKTAGGEVTACESKNRDEISKIIQALNQAIISRG